MARGWLVLTAFLGLAAAGSCTSYHDYCEEKSNCEVGNDEDVEACEVEREHSADRASLYGCSEYYDAYQECLELESVCINSVYTLEATDCNDQGQDLGSCMSD
jgi:hypothetical protein